MSQLSCTATKNVLSWVYKISYFFFVIVSMFNGWSAYDIVGTLKSEVLAALLDYSIERSCFRTWDSIEDMLMNSSDDVKSAVYRSQMAKAKVEEEHRISTMKRHREAQEMSRKVRRRLGTLSMSIVDKVIN